MPQMDGSTDASKNCVPATGAGLIDRATVSTLRVRGADVRRASGIYGRGLSYGECAAAVLKLTTAKGRPVQLDPAYGLSRATVKDTVAGGEACGVSIHTSVTRYTTRRTNYYIGNHTVHAEKYRWRKASASHCDCEKRTTSAHGEYLVDDPGTTLAGYLWWSADLLYRAAEKRTNGNGINLLVAPDTEILPWQCVKRAEIRSTPSYSTGRRLGYSVPGRIYKGGRTETGGRWKRSNGTYGNGWVHIVIGQTDAGYKWGWVRGSVVV
ncbi:MAG: hypothetical protein ACO3RU_13610 [Planctomycetota bacterium]